MDNVNNLQFILDYRAVLQSNQETHRLGDSATSMYAYTIYLWATPVILTLVLWSDLACFGETDSNSSQIPAAKDLDVDSGSALAASEWLRANVLLDKLRVGDTCYVEGDRPVIWMKDLPKLQMPH